MKKIITIFVLTILTITLVGCENAHIKSQFKNNSYWLSEDLNINMFFQGPVIQKGYGEIIVNEESVPVIYEFSEYYDKLFVESKETLELETYYLTFDLKVVILDKKFVKDQITALVSSNQTGDLKYDEYKVLINRTDITNEEIDPKDFIGVNYYNHTFGMQIKYSDELFFDKAFDVLINDRPKNIHAIFKFSENKIFEIYQEDLMILTGIYRYEDNKVILQFGKNELYLDTNEIILELYISETNNE